MKSYPSGPPTNAENADVRVKTALSATVERHVVPPGRAGVNLPRPTDAVLWILHHLFPLADPAHRARHREQCGEHAGREAHRLQDDAGIEIDVRVQLAVDEVAVVQ